MGFLELRQEPGVYSRVTAGMSIRNSSLFIEVCAQLILLLPFTICDHHLPFPASKSLNLTKFSFLV